MFFGVGEIALNEYESYMNKLELEEQLRDSIEERNLKKYRKTRQKITQINKEVQ